MCVCVVACTYVLLVTLSCCCLGGSLSTGVQGRGTSQCDSELVVGSPLAGRGHMHQSLQLLITW